MLPYAGKKIKPPPEVSQQLSYNDWKQLGFLLQEIYNGIIPVFSNPSSGPPLAWPGTDWDSIPQSCRFAPNGTSCICGSYPWAWLPLAGRKMHPRSKLTHGFILSELPEKTNVPHLKTHWARSVFHWCDCPATIFIPPLGTRD